MNTFSNVKDLNKSLLGVSRDVFYVTISNMDSGNQIRYSPSEAAEWLHLNADSIITSNKQAVLLQVAGKQFKLRVWCMTPQPVDLMGI